MKRWAQRFVGIVIASLRLGQSIFAFTDMHTYIHIWMVGGWKFEEMGAKIR